MAADFPHGSIPGDGGPGDMTGLPPRRPGGWTVGRIVAVVAGSLLALLSIGLFAGGAIALWADQAHRQAGDISMGTVRYSTNGYALATDEVSLPSGLLLTGLVGDVRIRVTPVGPGEQVFVAIGPASQVAGYLAGVPYTAVTGTGRHSVASHLGSAKPAPPRSTGIWVSEASGPGTQTLRWTAKSGDWMAVAMNPDGSPGLTVNANAGVSAPGLFRLAVEVIIGGAIVGLAAAALIVVPVRMARAR